MDIEMEDYLSIQEFSSISGVEASTLRYWDDIGLFSPIRRNPDNNYRYYSLAQLIALNFVTVLSNLEFPLKVIGELRKERDPDILLQLLEKQEKQMDMEMRELQQRYSIIHARREMINYGVKVDEGSIFVVHKPEESMIQWPRNAYEDGETFLKPLAAFIEKTGDYHINLSFPVGGMHDDVESFRRAPECPDYFVSFDPVGPFTRKGGDYLTGYARGYYGDVGDLPNRMIAYAKEHSLSLVGPVYTMYLHDEICTKDLTHYLAQCYVAVSKRKHSSGVRTMRI